MSTTNNSTTSPIPQVDISPFLDPTSSQEARDAVVSAVREACLSKGFLSITGHAIPTKLQMEVFEESAKLFALSDEQKNELGKSKSYGKSNRGYEKMYEQTLSREIGGLPDAKEGFYLGVDLPIDSPRVQAGRFNCGPNLYPSDSLVPNFKPIMNAYHTSLLSLSQIFLRIMALSLSLPEKFFESPASQDFATNTQECIATLRLLHYPPVRTEGYACAAHTDFGAITMLLQDSVGGLQVWDTTTDGFLDVPPPWKRTSEEDEAYPYVVNLGDAMARWTNDLYRSTLHRVVHKETVGESRSRYSVPFFFNGNADTIMAPLDGSMPKHEVITIEEHLQERYTFMARPAVKV